MKVKPESRALNDFKIFPHFSLKEFECPCCHRVKLVPYLVYLLEKLRGEVGLPIIITSGYRCEDHNRKIGGRPHSFHLQGMAADVSVSKIHPSELGRLASEVGFDTILVYRSKWFCHLDIRKKGLGLIDPYIRKKKKVPGLISEIKLFLGGQMRW